MSYFFMIRKNFLSDDEAVLLDDVNKNHRLYEAKFVNYVK